MMTKFCGQAILDTFTSHCEYRQGESNPPRIGSIEGTTANLHGTFDLERIGVGMGSHNNLAEAMAQMDDTSKAYPWTSVMTEDPTAVQIAGTIDFDKLAEHLNNQTTSYGVDFNETNAKTIYLVCAGRDDIPREDNTVTVRTSRKDAETIAEVMRKESTFGYLTYSWVDVFEHQINGPI